MVHRIQIGAPLRLDSTEYMFLVKREPFVAPCRFVLDVDYFELVWSKFVRYLFRILDGCGFFSYCGENNTIFRRF